MLLFVLFSVLTFGLFAPDARHRLPLALVMSPFAALAVADWARVDRWKTKTAAILCLLVATNLSIAAPARLAGAAHHHYWMGIAYARQGMTAHAMGEYHRAHRTVAGPPEGDAGAGRAVHRSGKTGRGSV